jgi:predicted metal-dependent phosphotriesterase family hydrolase
MQLCRYGGWGYEHLVKNVPELMRGYGLGEGELAQMLVANPRRLLELSA